MSDKELDDFFKELSSRPDIPFVPEDWVKMEKILDQNTAPKPVNGYKWIFFGLLMLLGITITVWLGDAYRQSPEGHVSRAIADGSLLTHLDPVKNIDINIKKPESILGPNRGTRDESVTPKSNIVSVVGTAYPDITMANPKTQRPIIGDLIRVPDKKSEGFEKFNRIKSKSPKRIIQTSEFTPIKGGAPDNLKNNIALALQVSPDLSAVKYTNFPPFGRSMGMSLEYFLSGRWSISGGALHSKKSYQQGPGYWEGYSAHESLRGICWILEVPVNFRYYPIMGANDKWFVSTGLSSYFMIKENYTLTYSNDGGYPYSKDLKITGNNQHVFGIWNISFGYERRLSRKLAVQVEPYYRLPLEGIGEGRLDLKSLGAFFGIKYYPSSQKLKF
ncbi:hypothetical protein SAMN04488057_12043 [Cyclobacterium lianum]|uniref:Outer membrane protein beta-barrel domain-containing protein n=2 Tax=Cyclobacterium lianum TaxID=388280 RepID=A0A1M7QLY5_9BACT|nr:hypothetical protein SAMN04488057_12043 [Cyclobacterium lianum]